MQPKVAALMAQDYFELAYDLQMQGDLDKAVYYYDRSITVMASPEAYTFMAWSESMRGNFTRAIAQCQKAIQLDNDFGNPWNDIGAYLLALGRTEEAIPFLEQALRSPRYLTYHYAHYNLGRAYEKLTLTKRARRKYQEALSSEPGYLLAKQAIERLDRDSSSDQAEAQEQL